MLIDAFLTEVQADMEAVEKNCPVWKAIPRTAKRGTA